MKYSIYTLLVFNIFSWHAKIDAQDIITLQYFDTRNDKHRTAYLTIKGLNAIYYSKKSEEETLNSYSSENTYDGVDYKVNLNSKDSLTNVVFTNISNNLMNSIINIFSEGKYEKYCVLESPNEITWKIVDETQVIGDYKCQKAITFYKGRHYDVWFTEQLPINFGPWKLHGLPGAVVVAEDSEQYIKIQLEKIDFKSQDTLIELNVMNNVKKIYCEEYLSLKRMQGNEIANKIQSKLPRGAQFNITKITHNWLEKECN